MKFEIANRSVSVRLTDAEPVEGATTGLRLRTVRPERVEFTSHREGHLRVELTGPSFKGDGTETAAHFTVKVESGGSLSMYPSVPQWLADVAEQVF